VQSISFNEKKESNLRKFCRFSTTNTKSMSKINPALLLMNSVRLPFALTNNNRQSVCWLRFDVHNNPETGSHQTKKSNQWHATLKPSEGAGSLVPSNKRFKERREKRAKKRKKSSCVIYFFIILSALWVCRYLCQNETNIFSSMPLEPKQTQHLFTFGWENSNQQAVFKQKQVFFSSETIVLEN
jgi:hypothetical protein